MMFSFTGSSIEQPSGQEPQEKSQSYKFIPVSVGKVIEPDQQMVQENSQQSRSEFLCVEMEMSQQAVSRE